jgi:heptosyltransferase III
MLQSCALFVGHDSGISHLAAAVGLPLLLLWGDTTEEIWRPPHDQVVVIKNSGGMNAITVEQVMQELPRMLDQVQS